MQITVDSVPLLTHLLWGLNHLLTSWLLTSKVHAHDPMLLLGHRLPSQNRLIAFLDHMHIACIVGKCRSTACAIKVDRHGLFGQWLLGFVALKVPTLHRCRAFLVAIRVELLLSCSWGAFRGGLLTRLLALERWLQALRSKLLPSYHLIIDQL